MDASIDSMLEGAFLVGSPSKGLVYSSHRGYMNRNKHTAELAELSQASGVPLRSPISTEVFSAMSAVLDTQKDGVPVELPLHFGEHLGQYATVTPLRRKSGGLLLTVSSFVEVVRGTDGRYYFRPSESSQENLAEYQLPKALEGLNDISVLSRKCITDLWGEGAPHAKQRGARVYLCLGNWPMDASKAIGGGNGRWCLSAYNSDRTSDSRWVSDAKHFTSDQLAKVKKVA